MSAADKEPLSGIDTDAAAEADESALTEAEQDRFRKMLEDAEAQIEALDKRLVASGVIRRVPGEPEDAADEALNESSNESSNEASESITENEPEKIPPKEQTADDSAEWPAAAGDVLYQRYDESRGDGHDADYAAAAPISPPVSDIPLRSAPWQLLAGFGISFAVRVGILGIWMGSYIDRRWLGDTGIGAMAIIVLVIFYSFYMLYRDLMRLSAPADTAGTADKNAADKKAAEDKASGE